MSSAIRARSRWRWALAAAVIAAVALAIEVSGQGGGPRPASPNCRAGLAGLSAIGAAVVRADPGTVVCVRAGAYGRLILTRSASGNERNVVVQPADLADPNGAGRVTFAGITIAGSGITVRDVYSTRGIEVAGAGGFRHDVIDHDDVTDPIGYGISILCGFTDPCSEITISANRVHDTCATCEGDAIRIDGWRNVAVIGNDIYAIHACAGCHTDTLQSYNDQYPTEGLTVERNYVHDTFLAQGLPFLKDGNLAAVRIANNLAVRMTSNGQTNGPGIDESTPELVITGNTYLGEDGYVRAVPGGLQPSAQIDDNVFSAFNVQAPFYRLTEDHNVYTGDNEWSFRISPSSRLESHPLFLCGSRCGDGTPAGDDYRLVGYDDPKSAAYGVGINWSPALQRYGPD